MVSIDFTVSEFKTLIEVMSEYGNYLDSIDHENEDHLKNFDIVCTKLINAEWSL
jgi:hypothetical protein